LKRLNFNVARAVLAHRSLQERAACDVSGRLDRVMRAEVVPVKEMSHLLFQVVQLGVRFVHVLSDRAGALQLRVNL
jgi:hypothetical protein